MGGEAVAADPIARRVEGNDLRLELGEGPTWDAAAGVLWWVDSEAGAVFHGTLDGDCLTVAGRLDVGERVGSVAPAADGGLLVAGERQVHVLDPAGSRVDSIRVIDDAVQSRLNDSACDPRGRFLAGSIRLDGRSRQEQLVSIDAGRAVRVVADGITVSNGLGFSPDGTTMYYVDSRPGEVLAFDYDLDTGSASGRRVVLESPGTPDGLAVDVDGNLWIAFFGDGVVRCLTPRGEVVQVIDVPVPHPTCPAFAGAGLDVLVITTALLKMGESERAASPDSGALYLADPGVRGLPATRWAGATSG
jgi:sugar lactone lactonase YvrE